MLHPKRLFIRIYLKATQTMIWKFKWKKNIHHTKKYMDERK